MVLRYAFVRIHGGGLFMGGATDERYNLSFIVQNGVEIGRPFIGVSIAYRLSAWGFLQSQEVTGSGNTNLGLRDQRLALHWINENIGAFGGDGSKVTIWGESKTANDIVSKVMYPDLIPYRRRCRQCWMAITRLQRP